MAKPDCRAIILELLIYKNRYIQLQIQITLLSLTNGKKSNYTKYTQTTVIIQLHGMN